LNTKFECLAFLSFNCALQKWAKGRKGGLDRCGAGCLAVPPAIYSPAVRFRCHYFCEVFSLAREQAVVIHKAFKITTWNILRLQKIAQLYCCSGSLSWTRCPVFLSAFL